ncbi:MAG: methyl-accepting chemotaxis protein [Lachnospiraceae bacterium]|nr:methyl-accepting chemotaxis protein [Lachnospiraceae bacterium]
MKKIKSSKEKIPKEKTLKEKTPKVKTAKAKAPREKAPKEKKQSKINLFGLRNKIFVCFLVPILFMIVVGVTAYYYAAEGMSEKFQESAQQTANMAMQYMDVSCTYIQSEGLKYAVDSNLESYSIGMMKKDIVAQSTYVNDTRTGFMASQTANPFISNTHFIPKSGVSIISTGNTATNIDGIYDDYYADMMELSEDGRNAPRWIDSHPRLDEQLEITNPDYFMAFQMPTTKRFAYIVIDIKEETLRALLEDIDFGNKSITGFVTGSGKELISERLEEGAESVLTAGEAVFVGQDYYQEALQAEEASGGRDVSFQGEDYLFIYEKSTVSNIMFCSLIPLSVVTGQAVKIKQITVMLVIIAGIAAFLIGTLITLGIQKNMKNISLRLNEVAQGDLTVQVKAQGHDEFEGLAKTATNMIVNTKKLVSKLTGTVQQLEVSAGNVNEASADINNYSGDITHAINEISDGMSKQAEHAHECVVKTGMLSDRMKEIEQMVESVEMVVDKTEKMIAQGTEIVQVLADRAKETSDMTARVGESIAALKTESETINGFVQTISDISQQTNLLSLNASIEAARAGEAGRGFAVVAEEIRKLADDSNRAAGEIKNNVQNISAQTISSVESAKEAEQMVALQADAVTEVIQVFRDMNTQMNDLFVSLKEIADNTEAADRERNDTLDAVENISAIIEETASSSALVREMASQLLHSVDKLSQTASALDEDMQGVKSEISAFKIE